MPAADHADRRLRRKYASPMREAAAAATQARIYEAAARLYAERGYLATTVADIAREADTSVPRVSLAGSKASLLIAAYCLRAGGDPQARTISDANVVTRIQSLPVDEALRSYTEWLFDFHEATAGLRIALREAAPGDPDVAGLLVRIGRQGFEECREAMTWARSQGLLHGDVDLDDRAHAWMALGSPESWSHLVGAGGWDKGKYSAWLLRTFPAAVFGPA
ncbi:helix-turn-helix domain-containing protein [Actinoplanes sp. NPDC051851]|uniref:TetR/AcrR family transcriptional regulator n=1 Tax=Actinoplanes sp. NPDC051851 TaxID=3154753 RepID=UPI0034315734